MNFIQKVFVISLIVVSHCALADYGYPIKNAIAATVVGTPEALKITSDDLRYRQPDYVKMPVKNAQFKRSIEKNYKISIFPDRAIPDVFWYV